LFVGQRGSRATHLFSAQGERGSATEKHRLRSKGTRIVINSKKTKKKKTKKKKKKIKQNIVGPVN